MNKSKTMERRTITRKRNGWFKNLEKTRKKMSNSQKGKKQTKETKEKRRKTLSGRKLQPFSEQRKRNMSRGQLGKKLPLFTDEHRIKIGKANLGKKNGMWKGKKDRRLSLKEQEKIAGREKPEQCEICGASDCRICFDHDHETGAFRGWLCVRCNAALGYVKDSPELLLLLVKYLNKHKTIDLSILADTYYSKK